MDMYEVNTDTLCLLEIGKEKTRVIERNDEFVVNRNIHKIIDESCKSFGSSLEGRIKGTEKLTNIRYKVPIVVSEYFDIIMMTTGSRRGSKCHYIAFNYIRDYDELSNREKKGIYKSYIRFDNNKKVLLEINKGIIKNQMNKCALLKHYIDLKNMQEKRYI